LRNACKILVGKPERERPLGIPKHRWEDNFRMDLMDVRWGDMDWIHLDQDRDQWQALVNIIMKLWIP